MNHTRTIAAVFIACAFVLFAMGCTSTRSYPVTHGGQKAAKAQQARLQSAFP